MSDSAQILAFGPFELDTRSGELRRDGAVVRLAPQPYKALTLLAQRAGELVTRDELRLLLWGEDNFVDFAAGLNFCIAQLRQALGDPASDPTFIVAVPRRGYKFIAPVIARPLIPLPASPAERVAPAGRRTAALAAAVAVGLLFAGGLLGARLAPRAEAHAIDLAAMQRFERAFSDLAEASPVELQQRVRLFEEAIARDARFSRAFAGLGDAKLIIGTYRAEHPPDAYAFAKAAAARALALDPGLGEAHAVFAAAVMYLDWDWPLAASHFERALDLAPRSPRVHQWFSRYLTATGSHARAIGHGQRAVELASGSPSARAALGMAEFYAGRFTDAIAHCGQALELMPAFEPARFCLTAARLESSPSQAAWQARLDELQRVPESERVSRAASVASALVHVGNHDGALQWLERAANHHGDAVLFAFVHPGLRPLHGHPRFVRLQERAGLGPYVTASERTR
jgi:DNA-binding winged helix-turn-helix (wHTH) protein